MATKNGTAKTKTKVEPKEAPEVNSRDGLKKMINKKREKGVDPAEAQLRREYAKRKAHALLLEETNDSRLIVFAQKDEGWYAMGWNSALIYAYDIAPRVCKKKDLPTIRVDEDLNDFRSEEGLVHFRSLPLLVKRLASANITNYEEPSDDIFVFEIGKVYSKADMKALRKVKYETGEELFGMNARKRVYPELRGLIVKAMKTILPRMAKLDGFYQDTVGKRVEGALNEMNTAYFELANERGTAQEMFRRIVAADNVVLVNLTELQETDKINPVSAVDIGKQMVDIKTTVKRIISKEEKKRQEEAKKNEKTK